MVSATATIIAALIAGIASIIVAVITTSRKKAKQPPIPRLQPLTSPDQSVKNKVTRRIFYSGFYFLGGTIIVGHVIHFYFPEIGVLDRIPGIFVGFALLFLALFLQVAEFHGAGQ
jgi:hypothetical protein